MPMCALRVSTAIICFIYTGTAGDLRSLVNGREDDVAMVGGNITFICSVESSLHTWIIDDHAIDTLLRADELPPSTIVIMGISFFTRIIHRNSTSFVTSLSFEATVALNGSTVVCEDRNVGNQSSIVTVFGECP